MAWQEFRRGKRNKKDVQEFEFNLEDNLFQLHSELRNKTYQHSNYTSFSICDPKPRRIHKAIVRDRVLHHASFRILYPIFDKSFIFDSYSCRIRKGTHRAVNRLEKFCRKLSKNKAKNIFALKCDVRKFFDSIDQGILLELISKKIIDKNGMWLVSKIIRSFSAADALDFRFSAGGGPVFGGRGNDRGDYKGGMRGLPLGNVTSQLFANIYLNELDQFIKHKLKIKLYLRYCDDFVILAEDEKCFSDLVFRISKFLKNRLKLNLHPDKIIIRKYRQGVDFLGYVVLPYCRVLRTMTRRRTMKKIRIRQYNFETGLILEGLFDQSLQSYLGVLKHCSGYKIKKQIKSIIND